MRHIETTAQLSVGMVVLTGATFYRVTDTFPLKFRGHVWMEEDKVWGPIRDVPLPSPTHPAHEAEDAADYFPLPPLT